MSSARLEIGISLGSNRGDRAAYLSEALARLQAEPGWTLDALSSIYETEPVEVPDRFRDQAYFNAVAVGFLPETTDLVRWAEALHRVEADLGRVRGPERNAPRPVDLDVIYAGSRQSDDPVLRLPHPRWAERRFVVEPLAEIRPDLRLPGQDKTVADILRDLPRRPWVRRLAMDGWPPPHAGRIRSGGK